MGKRKSKEKKKKAQVGNSINPTNAKMVLFFFGVGPIMLLFIFLGWNGFFN